MTVDPFAQAEPADPQAEQAFLAAYAASLRHLCDYDPRPLAGAPIGMFHCPNCACMVFAGMEHPKCDPDFCLMADPDTATPAR